PYVAIIPYNYAYIIDLAVTEKSRGLGIGTLLLDAADQWAKARNLDYLELGVLENNLGAKKLYEKLGFESMSTIMRRKLS
ncbi:MAG: GNAT family N-acetyltransferase, partial [Wohlfahrtiimonas sp.]